MTSGFNMFYVGWCSACVEGAFKYYILACTGSTKQLITTQTCRVYKFYSTSLQSRHVGTFCTQLSNKTDTYWSFRFIALSYCSGIGCPSRGNGF